MPTVIRIGPYRFYFYSNERNEPPHIHVQREKSLAKYWLNPVSLAKSRGFAGHELRKIQLIVAERENVFLEAWREHLDPGN